MPVAAVGDKQQHVGVNLTPVALQSPVYCVYRGLQGFLQRKGVLGSRGALSCDGRELDLPGAPS